MITLNKDDLHSQEGMERAFRAYFQDVAAQCDGTFNAMLGARLYSCSYEGRQVVLAVETQPWMANPNNIVHGGVTASLLDLTMGLLARYCSGGGMTPTVSMEVSYLLPAPLGQTLLIGAELTHGGFSLCHVTGRAYLPGQERAPVCTAAGVYYVSRKKDTGKS